MVIFFLISKHISSIIHIPCFTHPSSAMASGEWEFVSNNDPWKVSAFVSAVVELFLSILLLLGAAIAFVTSRFVKFFGLEPPCTYIGCPHPLHSDSFQGLSVSSCKSEEFCVDELCPDCRPSRFYSKLRSISGGHDEEEHYGEASGEKGAWGSRSHSSGEIDADDRDACRRDSHKSHPLCDHECSCCDSPLLRRRNLSKCLKHAPLVRSTRRSSSKTTIEDHLEIFPACEDPSRQFSCEPRESASAVKTDHVYDNDNTEVFNAGSMRYPWNEEHSNRGLSAHEEDTHGRSVDQDGQLQEGRNMSVLESRDCTTNDGVLDMPSVDNDKEGERHLGNTAMSFGCSHSETCTSDCTSYEDVQHDGNPVMLVMGQHGSLSNKHKEEITPLQAEEEEGPLFEEDQEEGFDALKQALQAERTVLAALEVELENERNAAAIATSEAMAMISRLQEEKSAMQMEVAQLQRMSDEKADYDEQAMALLKEILFKREKENIALEKEVELYRERLFEEKAMELKRSFSRKENGSPSPLSLKPLLLRDEEEDLMSPVRVMNQLEEFHQPENATQAGQSVDFEEFGPSFVHLKMNKRLRDSPMGDKVVGMSPRIWDDEWRSLDGSSREDCNSGRQLKKMGRSVFSTDDEETQFILERLGVLEEELQELRAKEELGSQKLCSKAHETNSHVSVNSKRQGEELDLDGVTGGFLPIHDVYEVQSIPNNRSPPCVEEKDEGLEGMLRNSELPIGDFPEEFVQAAKHRQMIPSKMSQARRMYPTTAQPAGWIVGKYSFLDDPCEHHDPFSQSIVPREEKHLEMEEIQQLALRLRALEEDRDLLRETLESFKHRDAEINLLQEIAEHLRELRTAGLKRVPGSGFFEDSSVASPGKSRAPKKRRFCTGQTQMLLLQQRSI